MIYFLAVVTALSLFWTPVSLAGYKDIDTKIAEQEIYNHIMKEEARKPSSASLSRRSAFKRGNTA